MQIGRIHRYDTADHGYFDGAHPCGGETVTAKKTKIAQLRKVNGWTQEQLAEESEVSLSQIKKLEAGTCDILNTSLKIAFKLAQALVSTPELF